MSSCSAFIQASFELTFLTPYFQDLLFYDSSGTEKTIAADIIANEFELDIYQIDLSTIVSKYIGEAQNN